MKKKKLLRILAGLVTSPLWLLPVAIIMLGYLIFWLIMFVFTGRTDG